MNIFSLILVIATIIAGIVWCIYKFIYDKAHKPNCWLLEIVASVFPVLAIILIVRSFIYEPFQIPSASMMPTLLIGDFIFVEKFSYAIRDPVFQKTIIKTGKPKRGDIVVFKFPKDPSIAYIKRAVGLPGDKITYDPVTKEVAIMPGCHNDACQNTILPLPISYSNVDKEQEYFFSNNTKIPIRIVERKETLGEVTHSILTVPMVQDQLGLYYRQNGQKLATWIVPPGNYFMMGDNRDNSADSRYWGFVMEDNLVGKATAIWMSLDKQEGEWPTGLRLNRISGIH